MNERALSHASPSVDAHTTLDQLLQGVGSEFNLFPLSFAQERLWILDQLFPNNPFYNIPAAFTMPGGLDMGALKRGLGLIVQRHETLRTTFVQQGDQPVQLVWPAARPGLALLDLHGLPVEAQPAALKRFATAEALRPFDLTRAPLMRATLLRHGHAEHTLIVTMHHIIADGWSLDRFIDELAACYAAYTAGQPPALAELPVQYGDYAAWQRDELQGEPLEQMIDYWRRSLAGAPAELALFADHPRPPTPSFRGAARPIILPGATLDGLRALSRRASATLFMTLCAVFDVLLYRLTDQSDLVVGIPVSTRQWPELEPLIGCFVNTLVLRVRADPDASFRALLDQVARVTVAAYEHQDLPFEKLVEALQPAHDLSRNPLFQVMFAYREVPPRGIGMAGSSTYLQAGSESIAKFDLSLELEQRDGELSGAFLYSADLFEPATISRMARHFLTLAAAVAADPDARITDLALLTAAERQQLLREWNDTTTGFRSQGSGVSGAASVSWCIHELVEAQAARTPDTIAVVASDGALSYAALNRRANQLAHHLRALGVGPDVCVGICAERSLELVIGLLGILKAGGAYVPLDPGYPAERLRFMLEDSGARVLVTNDARCPEGAQTNAQIERLVTLSPCHLIDLCADWPLIARQLDSAPESGASADNLAYVIYTSGSTGQPKGAMLAHRGIVNRLYWMQTTYQLAADDTVLQKTPTSFDVSVWEFFWPLMVGARLVLVRPGGQRESDYLAELIWAQRITTLHFVPAMLRAFLETSKPTLCRSLRRVICSGEALSIELQQRFFAHMDAALYNLYGPTEAAVDVTAWTCVRNNTRCLVPIGRPISNTQIYLLDRAMQPVPVGVPGELYIGGVQLARGYRARPDLTAERFVPNPFADERRTTNDKVGHLISLSPRHLVTMSGSRLYRTGDRARYAADGSIEYLGRLDQQIKLRGFRIELGEIEATLRQHPMVQESVVLAQEHTPGDVRLVAYVVVYQLPAPSDDELRSFLQTRLPSAMVPATFVLLPKLPLTPNGKVDRRALPAPDGSRPTAEHSFTAPRTPIEDMLAAIWSQVLGTQQVGVHDNFFALGGHSLLATQVMARIRSAFEVELPLRQLFEAPTIAKLAEQIEAAQRSSHGLVAPPIRPVSRDQAPPLSFAQQRLWFLDQLEPHSAIYTISAAVRLSGSLDLSAVQRSFGMLVRRHEVLRTTFPLVGEQPIQLILPAAPILFPLLDLRNIPAEVRESAAARLANVEAHRSFNLARGPLMRVTLVRLAAEEHVLLVMMHHIISDGWSTDILVRELNAFYTADVAGQAPTLSELPIQYADFAVWQRAWLREAALEAQIAYWRQQLADLPMLDLPTDHPRPPINTFRGARQGFELPAALSTSLVALSRAERVTLFMVALAAFQVLMARYSGQDDVVVGTPVANRTRTEIEHLIGFFVNTLVLRLHLAGVLRFCDALKRVRELVLEAHAHQDLPFEQLVEMLQPTRDLSHNPLFQVMFTLERASPTALELPNLRIRPLAESVATTKFDLSASLVETQTGGLFVMLEYRTDLFEATTIKRLQHHFMTLLEGIVADPQQRLADLPLLSAAECHQLLVEWNAPLLLDAETGCVHDLIERQAAATPDAIALAFEDAQLTYAELNRRANQLAHYLRSQGVHPEALIGLCLERSLELVIALLGVLKADSGYLPLDPADPAERLSFMLNDAHVLMLITTADVLRESGLSNQDSGADGGDPRPLSLDVCTVLDLCADWSAIVQAPMTPLRANTRAANLAYLIYTSGTMGRPKAVMVTHHNLVQTLSACQRQFPFRPGDHIPWLAALTFDISLFELIAPLLAGATVHLLRRAQTRDVTHLRALLPHLTCLHAVPSLLERLVPMVTTVDRLRLVFVGGELVPPTLLGALEQAFPLAQIWILYGPTEGTILSTAYQVLRGRTIERALIGSRLPHAEVRLYDARNRLVPAGVAGEIYLGGGGMARGYLNRPDLTAERFVPNPFATNDEGQTTNEGSNHLVTLSPCHLVTKKGDRLYKTGDLARWQPDGVLEFLGRIDDQVKIRGYRIELGEIAAVLGQHSAVRACAVVAREDVPGDRRLVAYVVQEPGVRGQESIDTASDSLICDPRSLMPELRVFLAVRLPNYMVPSAFVLLDALPLTPNGKIDRRALPMPAGDRPTLEHAYVAPRNSIEELLTQIWAAVLQLDQVGIHDNFFELGGHSLLATQVLAHVRRVFQVEISVRSLFQAPTIAVLAQQIAAIDQQGADLLVPPLRPVARDVALPLSFAQQRLWFLEQLEPHSSIYNIPAALRLNGPLSIISLAESLNAIVVRHEVLRTRFTAENGRALQVIAQVQLQALPLLDLQRLPADARLAATAQLARVEAQRPFDLARGPLVRTTLLRLPAEEHILLLTLHHIIADGWSVGVFCRELAALYAAAIARRPAGLPDLPIQYADYAVWQRAWLQGTFLESHLAYWRRCLADLPALQLPTDRPRPEIVTYRSAYRSIMIPQALSTRLATLCRREEATLFMVLLAAWQVLLARYSGQEDIVVGTPVANRTRPEIEGLIGFFVNMLALRSDLAGNPSFRALLEQVREVCLEAYAHENVPFEQVVEMLQPQRELSRHPLFQAMIVLQNAPEAPLELPGVTIRLLPATSTGTRFDLTLSLAETVDGLAGALEYSTDLFDAATIARMVKHYQILLTGIAADAEQPLACLPLLTSAERQQVLVEWNATRATYPDSQCIHTLFEAQVARTPDAVALLFGEEHLTYRELNARANQLAHHLRRRGVGLETIVALHFDAAPEMIVALLGVLKAGGAYLPLDPAYPSERISFMLEDSGAALLITASAERESGRAGEGENATLPFSPSPLLPFSPSVVDLGADWAEIAHEPTAPPDDGVTPANLAYLIYTSGSTGHPKGALIEHGSAVNFKNGMEAAIYRRHADRFRATFNAPLTFDASVQQIMLLLDGHTLYLLPDWVRQDSELLLRSIRSQQLDLLNCTPTQLQVLVASGLLDEHEHAPAVGLIAGEAVTQSLWSEMARASRTAFYNNYGPTECTVNVTSCTVQRDRAAPAIGRPLANYEVYILNADGLPVPLGAPGELYVGGPGLARGYLGRPDLTADRFVPDPFAAVGSTQYAVGSIPSTADCRLPSAGCRLYKTGDLARYRPDGNIEFLGRTDYQVKIRGFRIEIGEVEAALRRHPAVQACVVVLHEDPGRDKQLVGYIVPNREQVIGNRGQANVRVGAASLSALTSYLSSTELRTFLMTQLPAYMIPSAFVVLDTLPLTPSGKLDRRALPAPTRRLMPDAASVPPRTPIEELLAQIWAAVLGLEAVGVHDNFFAIGGHSLLATQVVARICDTFRIEASVRSVFEAPTIAELATYVEAMRQSETSLPVSAPRPMPHTTPPLSFAQQRLWFLDQLMPNSAVYNLPAAIGLIGKLELAALKQSMLAIVRRHAMLRTTFRIVDGQPVQIIAPDQPVALPLIDLQALPADEREGAAHGLAAAHAQRPFDLGRGPLLQMALLRLSAREHVVLLNMHHIVADGWSIGIFTRELTALYTASVSGQPASLPELPIQYADFAIWQRNWFQGPTQEDQLAYWLGALADLPALQLPTDRPRSPTPALEAATFRFVVSKELHTQLLALSRAEGATLFMTLLAAFQIVLARYSGQDDIAVGTDVANRRRAEFEGLIGFFVNQLVLRADLSGNPRFQTLLAQVREVALGAYAHQDLPFEQLVKELNPDRNLASEPLFQVKLILQNAPLASPPMGDLILRSFGDSQPAARFDVVLSLMESPEGLAGALVYRTALFDSTTIARLAGQFQTLLASIVAQPAQRLANLQLLSAAERQQLLLEWNKPISNSPSGQYFHRRFEGQAACRPDAIAVVCEDRYLTYQELNARANQVACYLQRLGVGPEVRVGLCVERSLDLLIGLLGVLKAGGAYVSLDPDYPHERLAFMISDSQAPVLLTQAGLVDSLPSVWAHSIYLDDDWAAIAQERDDNLGDETRLDQLAYVIYTSGSTGTPKGTLVSHRGLCNVAAAQIATFDADPESHVLQFASISFDAAIFEIIMALAAGAQLCLVRADTRLPGPALARLLRDQAITHATLTPSTLAALPHAELPDLRTINAAGEICPASLIARWAVGRRFFNLYGPTEATIWTTVMACSAQREPTIGRPIQNTQVYLLDGNRQPVSIGVPGELYIGGDGLARGYLGRPELTAERFISNPFALVGSSQSALGSMQSADNALLTADCRPPTGTRLYRTGDLARYRSDGTIEFLGRSDRQVKIRGFRIELDEVEAALALHAAVRESVVLAHERAPGDTRLVAYVVPAREQETGNREQENAELGIASLSPVTCHLSPTELREFLAARLPSYMLPAAFVLLDALPLTPGGKLDRRALPEPDGTSLAPGIDTNGFQSPIEERLARIWADVLGLGQIDARDNFFALGGDSILGIQMIARAHQEGLHLTPGQLFQHQTLAELAQVVQATTTMPIAREPTGGPLPLTPIQRWFFEQNLPAPQHYNQALLLEVRQPLVPRLLARALRHLVAQHEALRLRFVCDASTWRQEYGDIAGSLSCTWLDLSKLPVSSHSAAIERAAAAAQASLDLAAGPLLRVLFFDCGATQPGRLLLICHHLVVDGVSWRVLLEDMQAAYAQLSQGQPIALPRRTSSFQEWAERLAAYAHSDTLREELPYWLHLARYRAAHTPAGHADGVNSVASTRLVTVALSIEETRALLQDVPLAYQTQINEVLLTALAQAWAGWTGQSALLIDLEGHGREDLFADVDLTRTVGWFTSLFPVLLDLEGARGPGPALKVIKEQLRQVPHHGIGYGVLRYLSEQAVSAQLRALPRSELSFNYLGQIDQNLAHLAMFGPAGESSGPAQNERGMRSHLLAINSVIAGGQLRIELSYSAHRHDRLAIERLAHDYLAALRELITHCQSPDAGDYTPSDFPDVRFNQDQLDDLIAKIYANLEDGE